MTCDTSLTDELDRGGLMWPSKNDMCLDITRGILEDEHLFYEFNSATTSSGTCTNVTINHVM